MVISLMFLALMNPAGDVPPLQDVLRLSARAVESFWEHLGSVNCTETVEQTRLGKDLKPVFRQQSAYDYLVLLQLASLVDAD